jgi:excisionase family DNA binding protein
MAHSQSASALAPIAVSPANAARLIGVHRRKVDAMIRSGLPVVRIGARQRRVLVSDLENFLRGHREEAVA